MDPILRQIANALQALAVSVLTKLGLIDLQGQQIIGDLDLLKSQAQGTLNVLGTIEGMLVRLQASVDGIKSGVTVDLTPVITAVNTRASASVAPSWWIPPPAPSSAPSSADNADAVWTYLLPYASLSAQDALYGIWRKQKIESDSFIVGGGSKTWMGVNGFMVSTNSSFPDDGPPEPDWRNLLPTDTLIGFLEREWAGPTWFYDARFGFYGFNDGNTLSGLVWYCTITQEEFELMKRQLVAASSAVPPVWPGLAGVTLGTPVALDVGLTVTTPMQGCLISLTSVPVKQGYFTFDDVKSYRNVGAVAFVSDDGQEEYPQTLGFESAVYCPKTMVAATAVKVRTAAGIVGTITPFTIP